MKWSEKFRISSHDTDVNGVVSASAMLRYLQETAQLHHYNVGPTMEEIRSTGRAFILSRVGMSLYRPVYEHEEITTESWACESPLTSFNRCGRVYRDGCIVAELISAWALVGLEDRRLYRTAEIDLHFGEHEPLELDLPYRVRIPRDIDMRLVGERTVAYSDIDVNRHMNNTNYPDMLCDYLPTMQGQRVISFMISFLGEAPLGASMKIYAAEADGVHYFRTIRGHGSIGIEAEIILEDIEDIEDSGGSEAR